MTADEYKAALAQLGWTHEKMAEALEVTKRTSLNYARHGAPRYIELAIQTLTEKNT